MTPIQTSLYEKKTTLNLQGLVNFTLPRKLSWFTFFVTKSTFSRLYSYLYTYDTHFNFMVIISILNLFDLPY